MKVKHLAATASLLLGTSALQAQNITYEAALQISEQKSLDDIIKVVGSWGYRYEYTVSDEENGDTPYFCWGDASVDDKGVVTFDNQEPWACLSVGMQGGDGFLLWYFPDMETIEEMRMQLETFGWVNDDSLTPEESDVDENSEEFANGEGHDSESETSNNEELQNTETDDGYFVLGYYRMEGTPNIFSFGWEMTTGHYSITYYWFSEEQTEEETEEENAEESD